MKVVGDNVGAADTTITSTLDTVALTPRTVATWYTNSEATSFKESVTLAENEKASAASVKLVSDTSMKLISSLLLRGITKRLPVHARAKVALLVGTPTMETAATKL